MNRLARRILLFFGLAFSLFFLPKVTYAQMGPAVMTGSRDFQWPVPGYYNITSCYYNYDFATHAAQGGHCALDIWAPSGTAIVAAYGGTVVESTYGSGWGNTVVIRHDNYNGVTLFTRYSHMSSRSVSVGNPVSKGQQVGTIGATGNVTGEHLDFSVTKDSYASPWRNYAIDPFACQLLELPGSFHAADGSAAACCYTYVNEVKALYANPIYPFRSYLETPASGASYWGKVAIHGWSLHKNGIHHVTAWVNGIAMDCPLYNSPSVASAYPGYPTGKEGFYVDIPLQYLKNGENSLDVFAYEADDTPHNIASHKFYYSDDVAPTITNVRITDVDETGYTLKLNVWDNNEIDHITFVTWTPDIGTDGFDDKTEETISNGFTYDNNVASISYRVNISDHFNDTGRYATHIYVYDRVGNSCNRLTNAAIGGKYWNPTATAFYEGHTYELYDTTYWNWTTAKAYCDSIGGYLVCITSEGEQKIIEDLLKNGNRNGYWIGATDQYVEEDWCWVTAEDFQYDNWGIGQPDDNSANEDYSNIWKTSGLWNDESEEERDENNNGIYGFICEYPNILENGCKITYHLNGGTNAKENPDEFTADTPLTLSDPSRDHYSFTGWFLSETGNEKFENGTSYDHDLELYARWEKDEELTLPAALTEIEEEAFTGNTAVEFVDLTTSSISKIGDRAFKNCSNLKKIYIPDSVMSFGTDVFVGCDNVVIVCNPGSAAEAYATANGIKTE